MLVNKRVGNIWCFHQHASSQSSSVHVLRGWDASTALPTKSGDPKTTIRTLASGRGSSADHDNILKSPLDMLSGSSQMTMKTVKRAATRKKSLELQRRTRVDQKTRTSLKPNRLIKEVSFFSWLGSW